MARAPIPKKPQRDNTQRHVTGPSQRKQVATTTAHIAKAVPSGMNVIERVQTKIQSLAVSGWMNAEKVARQYVFPTLKSLTQLTKSVASMRKPRKPYVVVWDKGAHSGRARCHCQKVITERAIRIEGFVGRDWSKLGGRASEVRSYGVSNFKKQFQHLGCWRVPVGVTCVEDVKGYDSLSEDSLEKLQQKIAGGHLEWEKERGEFYVDGELPPKVRAGQTRQKVRLVVENGVLKVTGHTYTISHEMRTLGATWHAGSKTWTAEGEIPGAVYTFFGCRPLLEGDETFVTWNKRRQVRN
eukprot:GFYU01005044.1.p1 GENE.GFYU01005044.1~~GFYU01005044.1.p1  ORF type:complete len:297 (-),score=17.18 GFYU01005044.1:134-1024(-)